MRHGPEKIPYRRTSSEVNGVRQEGKEKGQKKKTVIRQGGENGRPGLVQTSSAKKAQWLKQCCKTKRKSGGVFGIEKKNRVFAFNLISG